MASLMPPDTKEEEKIIGGKLTSSQLGWLSVGVIIYVIFCIALHSSVGFSVFVLGLPFCLIGLPFAFKKYGDMSFFKYHTYKIKYKKSIKEYANFGNQNMSLKEFDFMTEEEK